MGLSLLVRWGNKRWLLCAPSSSLSHYGKRFKDRDISEAKISKALLGRKLPWWLFFSFPKAAKSHNSSEQSSLRRKFPKATRSYLCVEDCSHVERLRWCMKNAWALRIKLGSSLQNWALINFYICPNDRLITARLQTGDSGHILFSSYTAFIFPLFFFKKKTSLFLQKTQTKAQILSCSDLVSLWPATSLWQGHVTSVWFHHSPLALHTDYCSQLLSVHQLENTSFLCLYSKQRS